MTRRRQHGKLPGQLMLPVHQLQHAQGFQGPDAIRGVGKAGFHQRRVVARRPVFGADVVPGVGESRGRSPIPRSDVPAHVVAVGVGHHYHVHILRAQAVGGEIVQQLPPRDIRRRLRPQPGIHRDGPPLRPDDKAGQVETHISLGGQMAFVAPPILAGDRREKVAQVKLQQPVRKGGNFHIADFQGVPGHINPPDDGGGAAQVRSIRGDYRLPAPSGQSSWTRTAPTSGWRRPGRFQGRRFYGGSVGDCV